MMLQACGREREVAELLRNGHWPAASSAELREHVSGCGRCGDLVVVTESFGRARSESMARARLDSPGLIWWRAQLRRRNTAAETMARPVQGAQVFALVVMVLAAVGFVVSQARSGVGWLAWFSGLPTMSDSSLSSWWSGVVADLSLSVLLAGVGGVVALGGVVVYLVMDRR